MATVKPRLQVTLKPHVYQVLCRLAELQGRPRSAFVAELLEEVAPPLIRTVALIEAARDAPEDVKRRMVGVTEQAERQLSAAAASGLHQLDWMLEAVAPPGEGPRSSNTGVRSTFNSQKGGGKVPRKGGKK